MIGCSNIETIIGQDLGNVFRRGIHFLVSYRVHKNFLLKCKTEWETDFFMGSKSYLKELHFETVFSILDDVCIEDSSFFPGISEQV